MARVPPQVLSWLHQVLQPEYLTAQRVYDDVVDSLENFPSLRPRTDLYTFADGRTKLLVLLHGSIPVSSRAGMNNTPLHVWIPHEYPGVAPIALVNPGPGMIINPGNHVDINRMCYHPYLAYWSSDPLKHTLLDAIKHLQHAFGKEPPLHQVSTSVLAEAPQGILTRPPPRPAKKVKSEDSPRVEETSIDPANNLNSRPPPPPSPPKPPARPRTIKSGNVRDESVDRQSLPMPPRRKPVPLLPPSGAAIQQEPSSLAKQEHSHRSRLASAWAALDASHTAKDQVDKEKVASGIRELEQHAQHLDTTRASSDQLLSTSISNAVVLNDRLNKAKAICQEMMLAPGIDVDECLIAQNRVYNQLYELTSSESAIDDTIYALGRALETERIDVELFIKHSRNLAREQFLKRALILKISDVLEIEL